MDTAYRRSAGQCECRNPACRHAGGRCSVRVTRFTAEFRHKLSPAAGGSDGPENCEVVCTPCAKKPRGLGVF